MLAGACTGTNTASVDAASHSIASVDFLSRYLFDCLCVDLTPLRIIKKCIISVEYSTPIYFIIAVEFNPGHPRRYPASAAAINDMLGCEPKLAC